MTQCWLGKPPLGTQPRRQLPCRDSQSLIVMWWSSCHSSQSHQQGLEGMSWFPWNRANKYFVLFVSFPCTFSCMFWCIFYVFFYCIFVSCFLYLSILNYHDDQPISMHASVIFVLFHTYLSCFMHICFISSAYSLLICHFSLNIWLFFVLFYSTGTSGKQPPWYKLACSGVYQV